MRILSLHCSAALSLLASLTALAAPPALRAQDEAAPGPLPALSLSPQVTVSGLSSGAAMAVQLHFAFSDRIAGAGIVAGAPYGCAQASAAIAVNFCMGMSDGAEARNAAASVQKAAALAAAGRIADPAGIAGDALYLFHGTEDDTVHRPAMDAVEDAYTALGIERLTFVTHVASGHGFLTDEGPAADKIPCPDTDPPFLNRCPLPGDPGAFRDQAREILSVMYGDLAPEAEAREAGFAVFDQSAYAAGVEGMDDRAFLYVPEACEGGAETCRLHIALHGCRQGRAFLGQEYARQTGYNEWAESNRIVVLYPQAKATDAGFGARAFNPKGCWDWWGYSQAGFGDDYLTREAPQMAAIARMAAALGAPLR